jgi:WhiB family transcriptional regulator, redox-sensing transcriptional regulator
LIPALSGLLRGVSLCWPPGRIGFEEAPRPGDEPLMSTLDIAWQPHTGWRQHAACHRIDPAMFFGPDRLEGRLERRERERAAKSICAHCPVRSLCREYALRTREPHGIWGGLTELDRRRMLTPSAQAS